MGVDTDRIFQTVLDPDWPFWLTYDRPLPPGQGDADAEANAAAALSQLPAAEGKVSDAATLLSRDDSASSDDLAAAVGASIAEQVCFNVLLGGEGGFYVFRV